MVKYSSYVFICKAFVRYVSADLGVADTIRVLYDVEIRPHIY